MPKTEETWMDGITTEMMEHICDDLCRHPDQLSAMELEDECAKCKMSRFVCDILNQYNKVNDSANNQCAKLMSEMHELKERDTAKKPIKTNDDTGIRYTDSYRCPNCGGSFAGTGISEFCYHCGQRLKWEG